MPACLRSRMCSFACVSVSMHLTLAFSTPRLLPPFTNSNASLFFLSFLFFLFLSSCNHFPSADSIHLFVVEAEESSGESDPRLLKDANLSSSRGGAFHPFLGSAPVGIYGNWKPYEMFATKRKKDDVANTDFELKFWLSLRQLCLELDSSNLPTSHSFFSYMTSAIEKQKLLELRESNKKKPFTFATEYSNLIQHALYCKEKSYSLLPFNSDKQIIKLKGCVRAAMKDVKHESLLRMTMGLTKYKMIYCVQEKIHSKNFKTYYSKFQKRVTNALLVKRFQCSPKARFCLPYGFWYLRFLRAAWKCLDRIIKRIELTE